MHVYFTNGESVRCQTMAEVDEAKLLHDGEWVAVTDWMGTVIEANDV